jgi:prepilin-type N-terminal cleavage/methylation domain-containing protein
MTFRRTGFTLIELVVVVAIIGILSMILLPSLSLLRNQANSTRCLSNLRQIGIGMQTYAGEHDDCVPAGQVPPPDRDVLGLPYWGMWWGFIEPYMPIEDGGAVYWCPSSCFTLAETRAAGSAGYQASYGMNDDIYGGSPWYAHRTSRVPRKDISIQMADHWGAGSSGTMDYMPYVKWMGVSWVAAGPRRAGSFGGWMIRASHGSKDTDPGKSRVGALFASGRVESLRWQDSYQAGNHQWKALY